jgi:hypothetical protein
VCPHAAAHCTPCRTALSRWPLPWTCTNAPADKRIRTSIAVAAWSLNQLRPCSPIVGPPLPLASTCHWSLPQCRPHAHASVHPFCFHTSASIKRLASCLRTPPHVGCHFSLSKSRCHAPLFWPSLLAGASPSHGSPFLILRSRSTTEAWSCSRSHCHQSLLTKAPPHQGCATAATSFSVTNALASFSPPSSTVAHS